MYYRLCEVDNFQPWTSFPLTISERIILRLGMKREVGERGLAIAQFAHQRLAGLIPFPPSRVDDPFGFGKIFRTIFNQPVDGKVLHHGAEKVFLTPAAE